LNFTKKISDIAGMLGIKTMLLPVYDFFHKKKALAQISKFDKTITCNGLNTEKRDFELIVSFTSFPVRIKSAAYVADAMLRQTLRPDKIILYLADNELTLQELPEEYVNLQARGLTIEFVENLKPHKKYFYAIKNFQESIVVTVDDDILYPENLLETLFESYKRYPQCVSAMRAHRILFKNGKLLPYNSWEYESSYSKLPQLDLFATGGAGALYPPKCMDEELFNEETIKKTSLGADDVWLKFMQLKKKTPVVLADTNKVKLLYIPASQKISLWSENRDNNRNDKIIKACMEFLQIDECDLLRMISGDKNA